MDDLTVAALVAEARTIWPTVMTDQEIVVALTVTVGDVARQVRDTHEARPVDPQELRKELGNVVLSTLRWMDDLNLDPAECIALAFASQRAYQQRGTDRG